MIVPLWAIVFGILPKSCLAMPRVLYSIFILLAVHVKMLHAVQDMLEQVEAENKERKMLGTGKVYERQLP